MIALCSLLSLLSAVTMATPSDLVLNSVLNPDLTLMSAQTFKELDPVSGLELTCRQCPPGQFLRARCTASAPSVCEDCPPGSFTALWNYIGRCLRCGTCPRNMVTSRPCTRERDCSCQCRHGYYYKERAGMCERWAECGTGHGANVTGSPVRNTECSPCPEGTFSDSVSSESACSAHSPCQGQRSEVVLKGNAWHDNICSSCEEIRAKDPAHFLRALLPSFFSHHSLSARRLRHLLTKLLSADGGRRRRHGVSGLTQDQLRTQLDQWISETDLNQIRTLPRLLSEVGASYTAERLNHKLERIETSTRQINHSCERAADQSSSQTVDQSTNQSTQQTMNQAMDQSTQQTMDQSAFVSTTEATTKSTTPQTSSRSNTKSTTEPQPNQA